MNKRIIKYEPLEYQKKFHESLKPKVYLSTGYGGGKTYALCMKTIAMMSINRGCRGGIVVPSYKMYKRDVMPTLEEICDDNRIKFKPNRTDFKFTFPRFDFELYVMSADQPNSMKGPNLAFVGINEVTLLNKKSFDIAISRVRLKKAKLRQTFMSGTPEDFEWAYEYFIESPRDDTDLIFGDMRQNIHVADEYVNMLMESYDDKLIDRYVKGKFINIKEGQALYAFDRMRHVRNGISKSEHVDPRTGIRSASPVWVTIDFNVNPMTAVLWNRGGPGDRFTLRAYDEIWLPDSNTPALCRALREKLNPEEEDVTIYPDPTGNSRSTQSNKSDIQHLKDAGFTKIKMKGRIKSVRDCLNAANALLHKNMVEIGSQCKKFISDCEQTVLKGSDLDKSNPMRTHMVDGFKNMADYEFPVLKSYTKYREQRVR